MCKKQNRFRGNCCQFLKVQYNCWSLEGALWESNFTFWIIWPPQLPLTPPPVLSPVYSLNSSKTMVCTANLRQSWAPLTVNRSVAQNESVSVRAAATPGLTITQLFIGVLLELGALGLLWGWGAFLRFPPDQTHKQTHARLHTQHSWWLQAILRLLAPISLFSQNSCGHISASILLIVRKWTQTYFLRHATEAP